MTSANKEKNFISAVVYVHNDSKYIGGFLQKLIDTLEDNFEHSEIICVDDNSSDDSVDVIRQNSLNAKNSTISVVKMSYFHGMELAMNAGMDLTIGDFVYEFDSVNVDYEMSEVISIYRKSLEGYDIVSAVSNKKERLSSKLFYKIFYRFSDIEERLHTESFRILSRRVINRIGAMSKTSPYRKAIYAVQGLKTTSVIYKSVGDSNNYKLNNKEKKYRRALAEDSLILFTDFGYAFSKVMSVVMMLMSLFMLIYSVVIYLMARPVEGWTTTILFLSVAFFGLFTILTIVIKYLQIIVDLVFKRKHYSFESIEKLTK